MISPAGYVGVAVLSVLMTTADPSPPAAPERHDVRGCLESFVVRGPAVGLTLTVTEDLGELVIDGDATDITVASPAISTRR